nr:EOG090X0L97 [Eurycercus lamellatus]
MKKSPGVNLKMATTVSTEKKQVKNVPKNAAKSNEEIVQGFQRLRTEQRQLANKLSELEMDLNEHKLVIETLQNVDADRKCFRMVGGVLVERTVKEVLPALTSNRDQMVKLIEVLNNQITTKGQEINDYKEKNNIRIRNQNEMPSVGAEAEGDSKVANQGVLVGAKP